MPQPLREGISVQYGPDALLKRPVAAAHMANVIANWAVVEDRFVTTYAVLMGRYVHAPEEALELAGDQPLSPPLHPVATQIFDTLQTFALKLELIEKLLRWIEPDLVDSFVALRGDLRQRAGERATIAHGVWGTTDTYPDDLILIQSYGPMMRWRAADFDDTSGRILTLGQRANEFHRQVYERCQDRMRRGRREASE